MKTNLLATAGALALAVSVLSGPVYANPVPPTPVFDDGLAAYYLKDIPSETEDQVHGIPGETNSDEITANGELKDSGIGALWDGIDTKINASAGFANIQGPQLDDKGGFGNYSQIDFSLKDDFAFTDLLFDIQLAFTPGNDCKQEARSTDCIKTDPKQIADELKVTAFFSDGTDSSYNGWIDDADWTNGEKGLNSLGVFAAEGLYMTHVLIQTFFEGDLVAGIFQTKHYQVSGAQPCGPDTECGGGGNNPVPVPGALPLLATGIAGLGYMARRRRKA